MAGIGPVAKLAPSCSIAVRSAGKDILRAPAYTRSLTGGEVREAARNAKARLIRASAAASESIAEQQTPVAHSRFLDLSVDDRVVVSLVVLLLPHCTLLSVMPPCVNWVFKQNYLPCCRDV